MSVVVPAVCTACYRQTSGFQGRNIIPFTVNRNLVVLRPIDKAMAWRPKFALTDDGPELARCIALTGSAHQRNQVGSSDRMNGNRGLEFRN